MAFVNLSLLIGAGLVAIPVILHLVMRQEPQRLVFPAVRFLTARHETNRRQLRIRHWILMALRGLAIAVLALALARPSTASSVTGNWIVIGVLLLALVGAGLLTAACHAQRRGLAAIGPLAAGMAVLLISLLVLLYRTLGATDNRLLGDPAAPVGAVLVIDTSPRMQFEIDNSSRLDKARQMAGNLLQQLPLDSEAAVMDSRQAAGVFSVDLAAAQAAIRRLQTCFTPRPLPSVLDEALGLAASSSKGRREVYVFTDMSQAAWTATGDDSLQQQLEQHQDIAVYLIDVGDRRSENFGLGEIELSAETMPRNYPLKLRVDVARLGPAAVRNVQLYIDQPDPRLPMIQDGKTLLPEARLRSEQTVQLEADSRQTIDFQIGGLDPGVHQGHLELVGTDNLEIDNRRYFTVSVKDAWPVLVVESDGIESMLLTEAISPLEFRKTQRARFDCSIVHQRELTNQNLEDFVTVCLLDPSPMPSVLWERIAQYVRSGGSLAVFLGHNAQPIDSFNQPAAQQLLAGRLARQWRSADRDLVLAPRNLDHPILAPFRQIATSAPWHYFPVLRHWMLDELGPDAQVIARYSNNQPALIENVLGRGRVIVMTTPVTDPARPVGRSSWNELPTGDNPWPYFVLVNELMRYLADSEGQRLNYLAGDPVALVNRQDRDPDRYQLFTPLDEPQEVQARDGWLTIHFTDHPGNYRLKGNLSGPVGRGFSVNLPPSASDLRRTDAEALDQLLGQERYRLATDLEDLTPMVGDVRAGREFFPFLIVMLGIVLALESAFSNRFYRRQVSAEAAPRPSLFGKHSFP